MASSVQERLQMSRSTLDKWTTREQLCLASAVSCSSDQNWSPSVSRTLKLVCGNGAVARPADWFSQKNCALQYSHLLENVETLKRKKRTSESGVGSPSVVETPTDSILRRLTEERINELKLEIRKEQEEYTKIYNELKAMQSGQLAEEQLLEMWRDIEKQQERQRIEEMKLENQMREREQQRQEIQRNWRTLGPATAAQKPTADTTAVDMDVEEIVDTPKPTATNVQQQQPQQQQQQQPPAPTGTSPLLSSLLKSTTAGGGTTGTPAGANLVRTAAPTITTLLTGGSIPNANHPALIVRSTVSPNEAAQILTRPISGPPMDATPATGGNAQNLLSPSQAAPTLSMLLEKTKVPGSNATVASVDEKVGELTQVPDKSEMPPIQDSNNEEVPMELEEDVTTHASNANVDMTAVDFDESDANEEQQLLEVFKNIGNIDELDIDVAAVIDDEEVDFLKGVDEDPPHDTADDMELEKKVQAVTLEAAEVEAALARVDTKNDRKTEGESRDLKETDAAKAEANTETAEGGLAESEIKKDAVKIETISSDDSNDNIPLAAVASLEQKAAQEKEFLKEKVESAIKNDNDEVSVKNEVMTASAAAADGREEKEENRPPCSLEGGTEVESANEAKNGDTAEKSPAASEGSDVIVIATDDDESNSDKQTQKSKQTSEAESSKREQPEDADKSDQTAENESATTKTPECNDPVIDSAAVESMEATSCTATDTLAPPPPTISIGDTDEDDSSATDASSVTRKDEKLSGPSGKHFAPQARKSLHDHSRAEPKTDEDSNASTTPAFTLARPTMLRKLRDRDRSESPMIDTDTSIANSTAATDHAGNQRSRRRYSSTPVADSVPNSPASSDRDRDEIETKVSKKSLLSIYHTLQHSKNAAALQRAFQEDNTPKYEDVCLRPIDFQAVKRSIELGSIRTVNELQRDIMLMCQNGLMLFKEHSVNHKAALAFMQECLSTREFVVNSHTNENANKTEQKETKEGGKTSSSSSSVKVRSGSRKSQRIS